MTTGPTKKITRFSKLTDGQLNGLNEAGASGNEALAYALLTRYHNDPERPAWCFHRAREAEKVLGMRADTFTRSLKSLCRKTFTVEGKQVPVLVQVERGHHGSAATYNDNLYAWAVLRDIDQVARQDCRPTQSEVARQECLPTHISRKADSTSYPEEVGRQICLSSKATLPSHKNIKNSGEASAGALRTPDEAERQPHKNEPANVDSLVSEVFDIDGATPRQDGAPRQGDEAEAGGVTFEEFSRIARKVAEGRESLTEHEKSVYHRGYPTHNLAYIEATA